MAKSTIGQDKKSHVLIGYVPISGKDGPSCQDFPHWSRKKKFSFLL